MHRTAAFAALTVALAACSGSGDGDGLPWTSGPEAIGDVDLPPAGEPFVTLEGELFVTGDGVVYRHGEEPEGMAPVAEGESPWEVAELTPDGLETLVGIVDDHHFFDPAPDYSEVQVTDSIETVVVITTAEQSFEHRAYVDQVDADDAGGLEQEWARYEDLLVELRDLPAAVDGEISEFEPYVPDAWDIIEPFGDMSPSSVAGELVEWPFATAAVEGCTTFPDDDVTAEGADGATGRYVADDTVVDVHPRFPWEGDC